MSAAAAFVRSWRVGRWTATLSVPAAEASLYLHAVIEWSPAMPGRPLTATEFEQYRLGREAAFAQLAREKGRQGVTLEFGTRSGDTSSTDVVGGGL